MDMEVQVKRMKDAETKSLAGLEAKLWPIPDALLRSAWKHKAIRRKMKAAKNKEPIIQDEPPTEARWPHLRQVSPEPQYHRRKKQHDWESWQKVAELTGLCFCETYIPMVQQPGSVEMLAEATRILEEQSVPGRWYGKHISQSPEQMTKKVLEWGSCSDTHLTVKYNLRMMKPHLVGWVFLSVL